MAEGGGAAGVHDTHGSMDDFWVFAHQDIDKIPNLSDQDATIASATAAPNAVCCLAHDSTCALQQLLFAFPSGVPLGPPLGYT
jgi:hypothetical protein